jgi:serine/threonine protein kinase
VLEPELRDDQYEKIFKYGQVRRAWNEMHGLTKDMRKINDQDDDQDNHGKVLNIIDPSVPTTAFTGFDAGPIGKGMVGNVFHLTLGTDATNTFHYAAKSMRKEDIASKSAGATQVLEEIEAMSLFEHPFILQMYCTWQTPSNLVILLDYMPGGELFMVIRKRSSGMFPHLEPYSVRFYAACVLSALTYLHDEVGYVYRDLKGENVLIDHQGYAKLCDFGFAKRLKDDNTWGRTKTVCGTPDYMAPGKHFLLYRLFFLSF